MLADHCDTAGESKRCNMGDIAPSSKKAKLECAEDSTSIENGKCSAPTVACHDGQNAGEMRDSARTPESSASNVSAAGEVTSAVEVKPKEEAQTQGAEDVPVDIEETSYGPTEGLRVEVNWVIIDEESGAETPTWFAGTLTKKLGTTDEVGRDLWELRYDAHGEFEETVAVVALEESGEMYDPEQAQHLEWKREGDPDDYQQEMTMKEVLESQEAVDRECGSVHDAAMSSFASLPPEQQRVFALKYRMFADRIKEDLAKIAQEKGPHGVVTEDDIAGIMGKLRR